MQKTLKFIAINFNLSDNKMFKFHLTYLVFVNHSGISGFGLSSSSLS